MKDEYKQMNKSTKFNFLNIVKRDYYDIEIFYSIQFPFWNRVNEKTNLHRAIKINLILLWFCWLSQQFNKSFIRTHSRICCKQYTDKNQTREWASISKITCKQARKKWQNTFHRLTNYSDEFVYSYLRYKIFTIG